VLLGMGVARIIATAIVNQHGQLTWRAAVTSIVVTNTKNR
jgi:hypothetical protein